MIQSETNRLRLLGATDLGASHAAFRLLEHLGCRWFFPAREWEVAPSAADLRVCLGVSDRPRILERRIWYGYGLFADPDHPRGGTSPLTPAVGSGPTARRASFLPRVAGRLVRQAIRPCLTPGDLELRVSEREEGVRGWEGRLALELRQELGNRCLQLGAGLARLASLEQGVGQRDAEGGHPKTIRGGIRELLRQGSLEAHGPAEALFRLSPMVPLPVKGAQLVVSAGLGGEKVRNIGMLDDESFEQGQGLAKTLADDPLEFARYGRRREVNPRVGFAQVIGIVGNAGVGLHQAFEDPDGPFGSPACLRPIRLLHGRAFQVAEREQMLILGVDRSGCRQGLQERDGLGQTVALLVGQISGALPLARVGRRERTLLSAQKVIGASQFEPHRGEGGRQRSLTLDQSQSGQVRLPGFRSLSLRGKQPAQLILNLSQPQRAA